MLNLRTIVIDHVVEELRREYEQAYGQWEPEYKSILIWVARMALENMANSDTVYHDMHHAIMVSLAAQQILRGKHLLEGGVQPKDWLHVMAAALCHDIGYVRGICREDTANSVATGLDGEVARFNDEGSNASLAEYHVNRGKLFIRERFAGHPIIDGELVSSCIEMTRFPAPAEDWYQDTAGYPGLVRAADLIGQLGDPDYLRKVSALFFELSETGAAQAIGCHSPGTLRKNYALFYKETIRRYIQTALRYLEVTQDGKQWIANLHAHVFAAENSAGLNSGKEAA
ncbi:MAG: metal-dependent phosphohydrolase [Verrucomicrobia bacterium]|nr:metal-dependent phosphohydrolase [Verrucomicrobiota bacterium]